MTARNRSRVGTAHEQEPSKDLRQGNVTYVTEVEWVDICETEYDRVAAAAWAEFAPHYPALAAELFDDDPDLSSRELSEGVSRL